MTIETRQTEAPRWQDSLARNRGAYPVHHQLQTRVGDLDGYGHLNAVRLGQYYEDARAVFQRSIRRDGRARVVVAQFAVRYLAEGKWPGDVEVGTGVVRIGTSSYAIGQALFQGRRCIGLCETVLVHIRDSRPAPLPTDYRAELGRFLISPRPGRTS